jgi:hypothetical protein
MTTIEQFEDQIYFLKTQSQKKHKSPKGLGNSGA